MAKRKLNKTSDSDNSDNESSSNELIESEFKDQSSSKQVKKMSHVDSDSNDSDNIPLQSKMIKQKKVSLSQGSDNLSSEINSNNEESDEEIHTHKRVSSKRQVKKPKYIESSDSDDEEMETKSVSPKGNSLANKSESEMNSSDEDMMPLSKLQNENPMQEYSDLKNGIHPLSLNMLHKESIIGLRRAKKQNIERYNESSEENDSFRDEEADDASGSEISSSKQDKSENVSVSVKQSKNVSEQKCDSSSDDEVLSKLQNNSTEIPQTKSKEAAVSCSDSDDEPLEVQFKKESPKKNGKFAENAEIDSSSDEEPLNKVSKTLKLEKRKKASVLSSDSDTEPLFNKIKKAAKQVKKKTTKQVKKKTPKQSEKKTKKSKSSSEENANNTSSDDEDRPLSKLSKVSGKKAKNNSSNNKIEHLKKYVRAAGIHIQSYDKFFEGCKSIKSKTEKLLDMLHEKGIKGRPTLEKCKKLKKKIETKKEIAELDVSNIITSEGRFTRGAKRGTLQSTENINMSPAEKRFSRLHDIIDSEESD